MPSYSKQFFSLFSNFDQHKQLLPLTLPMIHSDVPKLLLRLMVIPVTIQSAGFQW
jgi:hypothetical protein